jgi:hypothetical protein
MGCGVMGCTGESTPEYGMCPVDKAFPENDQVTAWFLSPPALSSPISSSSLSLSDHIVSFIFSGFRLYKELGMLKFMHLILALMDNFSGIFEPS